MGGGISETQKEEFIFVQYVESTEPMEEADSRLGYVCLRWSTADEVGHIRGLKMTDNHEEVGDFIWY